MNRIKELRSEKKITQDILAKKLGITQAALSKWETEKAQPDQRTLLILSEIFGVSIDYILGNTEQRTAYALAEKDELLPLSPYERQLIIDYRKLNKDGERYIRQQMDIATTLYIKDNSISDVETRNA